MAGRRFLPLLLGLCLLLTGCNSLLEREYNNVEPHSSKFWESEAADTLRAENYQDIVNDLLILIGQHTESATVRLYNYQDEMTVGDTLEMAAAEILTEEPLPLILDDVFAFYDDKRLESVLQWLGSGREQVILLTCQRREERILSGNNSCGKEEFQNEDKFA